MSIRLLRITIITLVLTFAAAGTALAVPPLPLDLYGTVKIDGQTVPNGTSITVQCGGVTYATTTTTTINGESYYLGPNGTGPLSVPGDDADTPNTKEGCTDGETVTFLVNGAAADETTGWASGVQRQVDLTVMNTSTAELTIPTEIPAYPGGTVAVPVSLSTNGNAVASAAISIDFDETCLAFNPTDSNSDNIPDTISFSIPSDFGASITVDLGDTDGELDIVIADFFPPSSTLPDGEFVTIEFTVNTTPACSPAIGNTLTVPVAFSTDPSPAIGSTTGELIPSTSQDGSVLIQPAVNLPNLSIPTEIPAYPGGTVDLPVTLARNGHAVTALAFSIDYDETCLLFDPNAANAVTFSVPQLFAPSYAFDATDTDSELDISLVYISAPLVALPDGTLLTVRLTVRDLPGCTPSTGNTLTAAVAFSTDPTASFGLTNGTSTPGTTSDGSILISGIRPSDCNGDGSVDAADLSACVLEIFDGDSTSAADAPNGSFPGTAGCDSNGDGSIDAGDLACTILTIFNGPNACGGAQAATTTAPAQLTIAPDLAATAGGQVQVPVLLTGNGHAVTTAAFSLRFDADSLSFDPADHNGDGLPDSVTDQLPAGALRSIEVVGDTINIVLADFAAQSTILPDGPLVTFTFQVKERVGRAPFATAVTFDAGLSPSLGSTTGTAVAVIAEGGAVQVQPLAPAVEIHLPLILNQ